MRGINIDFGGRVRTLRMDFNAICDLEQHFGKGISHIFAEENIGLSTIRAFYWAGLRHEDKSLTLLQVGDFIQDKLSEGDTIESLLQPVMESFKTAGFLGTTEKK